MYRMHKKAQMRLSNIVPICELAPTGRAQQIHRYKPIGRFAKKRKFKPRDPQMFIPNRPIIETLIGSIERNHLIKDVDKWNGGEN